MLLGLLNWCIKVRNLCGKHGKSGGQGEKDMTKIKVPLFKTIFNSLKKLISSKINTLPLEIKKTKSHSDRYLIQNVHFMRTLFYIIAVVLLIGWALGTFVYALGNLIYILLVLAIVALVLGVARKNTRNS